ncbi:MAG: ATP-binding protein [Oscillospiraceae bacterium]|nr:ATP-binding protein [Oscillospiraceae bacterium]
MHGTDIYSFLSNLLSNAIEYLKTDENAERYIALDIVKSGEMVKIRQENAVSAPITVDRESGLPQTTKADRENHGFGVKSMTEVVSKYGGNILFDSKGGKFTVVALIPIP